MQVIVGAGSIGSATARALLERGMSVRLVSRGGRGIPGAEGRAADARDLAALTAALEGAEVVYQCAQPPYARWEREFPALQETVLAAAERIGARVVLCDNLYGYGPITGAITEESPRQPHTRKGRLRLRMAEAALASGVPVALLRPSNYVGPGYDQTGHDVFRAANRGKAMRFLGSLDQPHSFSYVPDVGRAMAALGTSETGWGSAWIAPVLPAITQRELAQAVWEAAGRAGEARTSILTAGATRMIGLFSPLVRELTEMMYEYEEPFAVDATRFEAEFGIRATPLDEAIRATLAAYPA